jgi:5-(carboxyamino)imidazole ribonucleotide synthase
MSDRPILPGGTIGILGSGQLGRMLALVARRMGYRVHTLSPDSDSPTGQVADWEIVASYTDFSAVRDFAMSVDVVTYEFENIPAEATNVAAQFAPVRPDGNVLQVAQNRLREKTFLKNKGFPVTPFAPISGYQDLLEATGKLGMPAVIKTSGYGYDGKGQQILRTATDLEDVRMELGRTMESVAVPGAANPHYVDVPKHVLEAFVDSECEISVVAARGMDGAFVHYGVVRNDHVNHILDVTTAPGAIHPHLADQALEIARGVLEALDVVGVMCVEMFLTTDGQILINEIAPRPHNSGHWTIEACPTSQFEQQLRAICGLPLGAVEPRRPAAMANLLGSLWTVGEPNWLGALAYADVHLHLYGKEGPRPGRKMGHLTALADTPEEAELKARQARGALKPVEVAGRERLLLLEGDGPALEEGGEPTEADEDAAAARPGTRNGTHLRWESQ